MALYQLSLFYPSVRQHAGTLKSIRTAVESVAGSSWRVVSAGEHTCAIVFETDSEPTVIRDRLGNFDGIEQFQFLLVEIADIHAGFLSKDVWQWIATQKVAMKKRAASANSSG